MKKVLVEIEDYLNNFLLENCLFAFIIKKNYSVLLIQIHQAVLSFLKDLKVLLTASADEIPKFSASTYDDFFAETNDLHSNDIIRRFNDEFFSEFLFSSPRYLHEFVVLIHHEKSELLHIILTEVSPDQMQHLLLEFDKLKIETPNNDNQLISKIRSAIASFVIEDKIAAEDIVVNLGDVITDGMFGKICLGTLKNADLYSSSGGAAQKKSTVPIRVAVELVSLNEPFLHKQRFGREIDALRKLSNAKCVLKVYGWIPLESSALNTERPVIGIVTETWHRTLTSLVLDEEFEPTVDVWLKYLSDIIKALSHIKRSGITYRTLKADSIVITSTNVAVISDLSLTFNQNYITTRTTVMNNFKVDSTNQQIVGSIGFTAPETYKGKTYDTTDIYSMGILISFVLFRESPWADETHTVNYSPQMTREPKFLTKDEMPTFAPESLETFRKCCNANHRQRATLAQVEQAIKKELAEVSKQLKIFQRTRSQLNMMTKVTDIATMQGVPIPKVPTLHKSNSTLFSPSKSGADVRKEPAVAVEEKTEEVAAIPMELPLEKELDIRTVEFSEVDEVLGEAEEEPKPAASNDLSHASFLSEIPNEVDGSNSISDDESIVLDPAEQSHNRHEALKTLSQDEIQRNIEIAESIDVNEQHFPSLKKFQSDVSETDLSFQKKVVSFGEDDDHDEAHRSQVKSQRVVSFRATEPVAVQEEEEEAVVIDVALYEFQAQTIEEYIAEIKKLHRHAPDYSQQIVLLHTIVERLLVILRESPAEQTAILMTEKNIVYEVVSYYQIFLVEPHSSEERALLMDLFSNWLVVLIICCYNYEDPYYEENGIVNPSEMIISIHTINHYHSIVDNPIVDMHPVASTSTSRPSSQYNLQPVASASGEEKVAAAGEDEKANEDGTVLSNNNKHVPYFDLDHLAVLTQNQLVPILLFLIEQVFLEEGKVNPETGHPSIGSIYAHHHVIQMNLLQLLLILLFAKENKAVFHKQSGLKILLLVLIKYYNDDNVIIVHNILLMIINSFYHEENIIKFGKLMNSCEVVVNLLNYHKIFLAASLDSLREDQEVDPVLRAGPSQTNLFYYHANIELLLEILRDLSFYIDFQFEFSQLMTCPLLIEILTIYLYQHENLNSLNPQQLVIIVEKALEAIICLAMNDQNEMMFGLHGIAELIFFVLKSYGFHYPKITENCFNAIRNLSKNNENKLKFSQVGTCELIVKLLTHYIHITNKRTSVKAMDLSSPSLHATKSFHGMGIAAAAHRHDRGVGNERGRERGDSLASDNHSTVSSLTAGNFNQQHPHQTSSNELINSPVSRSVSGLAELNSRPTASPAGQPAQPSLLNPIHEIIKSALSAITNLSVMPENKTRFGNCQTCELIVIILFLFGKQSVEVTKKAFAAIGNLSVINENKVRFANNISTNIGNQVVTINSFEVLVFLLNRYALQNIEISKKGLAAVGNLSVNHENKVKLGLHGINSILFEILQTYGTANEEVAQNGLGALANLAAYVQNNREFMAKGIDQLVMEIMRFYDRKYLPHHSSVQAMSPTGSFYGQGNVNNLPRPASTQQLSQRTLDQDQVLLEILKNGFGAINKFIAGNQQIDNLKKFSEEYQLYDFIVNLLKKIIVNHREVQVRRSNNNGQAAGNKRDSGNAADLVNYDDLAHMEVVKQIFQTINHMIISPKIVKKFRHLGLKELLKKYFANSDKASEIVVKISRTNSLFW